jgi:serine/threonine protein kinase
VDGTPFGRYRLIELIGRGGMGEVWRAHDTDTDRIVAIKVLPAYLSDNETFQQRFRREAHAAARLNTPHVVPIHHYGEIDCRLYVDMRLIEGRDLQTVLTDGPLEPARAVRIIEGVAKALHAAHKVGLMHRDVKPSNILLDEDDFAYLIDFGIARAAADTRLTSSGSMIGTLHYMAPERLGTSQEDARADIYALACVLYECLTGSPPFTGDSAERLMMAHLSTPPPQPSSTTSDVPAQFDQVIATGMAKDPDDRYATTVELAAAARDAITVPIPRPAPKPATPHPPSTEPAPNPAEPTVVEDKSSAAAGHQAPRRAVPRAPKGPTVPPRRQGGAVEDALGISQRVPPAHRPPAPRPGTYSHPEKPVRHPSPVGQNGRDTSYLAVWAMIVALTGLLFSALLLGVVLGIAGIVMAIIALRRIKPAQEGRRIAIAAIATGVAALIIAIPLHIYHAY